MFDRQKSSAPRSIGPLIDGHRRFRELIPLDRAEEYRLLAKGQSPLAVFVTCSDSRVQPQLFYGIVARRSVRYPQCRQHRTGLSHYVQ